MTEAVARRRRQVLTDNMVAALKRQPIAYFVSDPELPKHGIRVQPRGEPSYYVITRDRFKKQRWIRIGSTSEMKIEAARDVARAVIARLKVGEDPFPPPPVKKDSVRDVIETWLKRHVDKNKLRTAGEIRRIVTKHILPAWADRSFADIRRSDIAKLLDHIEEGHGVFIADATLGVLRSVATWYAVRDDNYQLPFVRKMRRTSKEHRRRTRILNDAEIRRLWKATDGDVYGAMIRVLMLTGQRRQKVLALKWADISPDGVWTIPTAPREKGNPGKLRLPPLALAIINSQPHLANNPYVFAGSRPGEPIAALSARKAALDAASGVDGYVVHDLRRTARSLLSRAGVLSEHAERVLGHAIRGVEGVYDVHDYFHEKADALVKLQSLIERIINPPAGHNVVPMHEAVS